MIYLVIVIFFYYIKTHFITWFLIEFDEACVTQGSFAEEEKETAKAKLIAVKSSILEV